MKFYTASLRQALVASLALVAKFAVLAVLAAPNLRAAQQAIVKTGIDVLASDQCTALSGRNVGLITNLTSQTTDGRRTVEVLAAAKNVHLRALFSPEHGWNGDVDAITGHTIDNTTGLQVFSLYGEVRKPSDSMLRDLDTLVFDIQDIGCRCYTYASTMSLCLEAAAEHQLRFVVLDRPNPLGGIAMEGPVCSSDRIDFNAAHSLPQRHGLTLGEMARMITGERGLKIDLQVIQCQGWSRSDLFDRTGLPFRRPSPNIRSLTQALLYPGIVLLERTNLSVGRGTDSPFEVIGAPWCDGIKLAAHLRALAMQGVTFVPMSFTPTSSTFANEPCSGVQIAITDWALFRPVATGVQIACVLRDHFPAWQHTRFDELWKDQTLYQSFTTGAKASDLLLSAKPAVELFRLRRKTFLLYE